MTKRGFKDTSIPMNTVDFATDSGLTHKLQMINKSEGQNGEKLILINDVSAEQKLFEEVDSGKTGPKRQNSELLRTPGKKMAEVAELEGNYVVYSSKLVKFREAKLTAVKFS